MINKHAFELSGVTEEEYKRWCKKNGKHFSKPSTKKEFFQKIQANKLVKDKNGEIVGKGSL